VLGAVTTFIRSVHDPEYVLSRDTAIHLSAVAIGLAVLVAASLVAPSIGDGVYVVTLLVFYAIVFGGAHAYLAWRGEDGMVPVDSRRRFVLALAIVLAIAAVGAFGPDLHVGGVALDSILFAAGGLVAIGYLVLEARAGYHERRPA